MVQIINLFAATTLLLGSANAIRYCVGGGALLKTCCASFTSQSGETVTGTYEPIVGYCAVDSGLAIFNLEVGLTNCADENVTCGNTIPA